MNEKMIMECLRLLTDRRDRYRDSIAMRLAVDGKLTDTDDYAVFSAYSSAVAMLEYAIAGDADCLAQYDYM